MAYSICPELLSGLKDSPRYATLLGPDELFLRYESAATKDEAESSLGTGIAIHSNSLQEISACRYQQQTPHMDGYRTEEAFATDIFDARGGDVSMRITQEVTTPAESKQSTFNKEPYEPQNSQSC